jgi:Icc-related predicted phosphoesterase
MRIVCLSDTHSRHRKVAVPEGDLLIHAGDLTARGTEKEVRELDRWLGGLPHPHKVVIAGNHDFAFERRVSAGLLIENAIYLEESSCRVGDLHIWGSPATPWFLDWAFNYRRGPEIAAVWNRIPDDVDIVVTHGPPADVLDRTYDGLGVGCADLARVLAGRNRLKLHVFGHIHEAYGRLDRGGVTYVNASVCNIHYRPENAPIVVDLP